MKNDDKLMSSSKLTLIALEQITETIDIMNNVLEKLQKHLLKQNASPHELLSETTGQLLIKDQKDRTIH